MTAASPGARFRAALAQERPLQIVGAINANHALLADARRLPRALPLRRRRRRRFAGHCPTWASTRSTTCSPTCGASPTSAIRRCWSTSTPASARARSTSRARSARWARPAPPPSTSRTRSAPSAAAIAPTRRSSPPPKWPTACARPSMRAATTGSSSSPAPTPSRSRARSAPSNGRWPASRPAPTAIFAEAVHDLDTYRRFVAALPVPVLANLTEFGQTPLFDAGRTARRGRRHGAVSAVGLPRHEPGGAARLRGDPPRRHPARGRRQHADARTAVRRHRLPRLRGASSTRSSRKRKS